MESQEAWLRAFSRLGKAYLWEPVKGRRLDRLAARPHPFASMGKPLVIVESPAKARTISGLLGAAYVVKSSIGNIRDLPRNAAEIPAKFKPLPWSSLGVDVDGDFTPIYVVPKDKKATVAELRKAMKEASELYLATDEDREGESIAWHLTQELKPKVAVKRMVFHELSKAAISHAVKNCRDLDLQLVSAQETRRVLDRLYGYEVSPVLWKKVTTGLSAGRVQSVFTRIVVERERSRMRFRSAGWWDVTAEFEYQDFNFPGRLVSVAGKRLAGSKDFSETGDLTKQDLLLMDDTTANKLIGELNGAEYKVSSVEEKPWRRSPQPPFMTSTLQQESGRKLRFSPRQTMQLAQRLYENGYITYMRTDSVDLSASAIEAARAQASKLYGSEFVSTKIRSYGRKTRNAQEAHEAIRPGGEAFRTPAQVATEVAPDQAKLYELIWMRTVASQMADASGSSVHVKINAKTAEFVASGRTIAFAGYQRAYMEGSDDPEAELEDQQRRLPELAVGQVVTCTDLQPDGHTTQPPARYTEAALVKAVEELGVGRPSTYASMIGTIQDRGYVWKKGPALVPSWTAFAVVNLLERHFPDLIDYAFTARMEDVLDEISNGTESSRPWLKQFYFGNGQPGLKEMVTTRLDEIDAREVNSIPIFDGIVVRVGRFGPFLQKGEETAGIPEDLAPDELTLEKVDELLNAPKSDRTVGDDPETGLPVYVKAGRYGPYVQLGEAEEKSKPKTASLFKTMDPSQVTLDEALRLLSLPRVVGADDDGNEIVAANGRYGPYIKKGSDSRSLETEEQLFTITLEEANAVFAQPKQRGGRRAAPPLKELGPDPATGQPVVVREGRYGPYVTDGKTNASLRAEDDPNTITIQRAAELLAVRRERGK